MNKLNKVITTIAITAMLSLPIFGAILKIRPNDVSWNSGPSTNDVSWNS